MSESGFIYLHRKMLNNPVCCKDANHIAVWWCLLLNAQSKEYPTTRGRKKILLKPGQVLISYREIEKQTKVHRNTVKRIIADYEQEGQITVDRGTDGKHEKTLITLNNWDKYQNKRDKDGTKSGTVQTQTTKGKTAKCGTDFGTTYNNKDIYISDLENLFDEIIQNFSPEFRTENDKTIFLNYFKDIENENEKINTARRMQSALNKMPEQSRPLAEFIKQWKTRKT